MLLVLGWGKARSRALGTADPAWEPEGDERSWTRTSRRMQRSHWKCSSVKPSAVWSEVNPAALEGSSWSSALHLWLHKLPPAFLHLHLSLALRELQGQPGAEGQEKGRKASGKTETGFLPFCFTTNPPILETKLINTAQSPQLLPALDQLSAHSEGSKPWMKALRGKLGCLTGRAGTALLRKHNDDKSYKDNLFLFWLRRGKKKQLRKPKICRKVCGKAKIVQGTPRWAGPLPLLLGRLLQIWSNPWKGLLKEKPVYGSWL